jgi:nitrite reductase/ring-hydroxylating ferredoxin subunit
MSSRHVVATVGEIAPGKSKLVTVKGREIGLFNVNGRFYALANRCPHAGGALCEGAVVGLVQSDGPGQYKIARPGEFLRCPWHGWEFEIATGQSWCDPKNLKIRQFPVAVEPGAELVKGPYVAETFPVTVEQQYVVVEL